MQNQRIKKHVVNFSGHGATASVVITGLGSLAFHHGCREGPLGMLTITIVWRGCTILLSSVATDKLSLLQYMDFHLCLGKKFQ